jgi:hypothetical protein
MGIKARRAVARLASEMGAHVQRCWHSGRCDLERFEARFEYRGYQTRIGAGRAVTIEMRGFECSVAFALGTRDHITLADQSRDPPPQLAKIPLFVNPNVPSSALDWLSQESNAHAVAALECSRREPLYVWYGVAMVVVKAKRASVSMLSRVADVVDRLKTHPREPVLGRVVDGLRLDSDLLPADLRALVPLIEVWAVGDDVKRQQLLAAASPEERDRLIRDVGPLLDRIDTYLNSFAWDEIPEEAALLGRLAEAVAELGGG